jgi:hypothetical protein
MDETPRRSRTKHRTSEERTPVGAQSAEGCCRNAINAILAAAAMNFHKLLGAFWRIFLRCLMRIWVISEGIALFDCIPRQNASVCLDRRSLCPFTPRKRKLFSSLHLISS